MCGRLGWSSPLCDNSRLMLDDGVRWSSTTYVRDGGFGHGGVANGY